ncbi:hypothetical protein ACFL6Y_05255 [Elusimicrobiota bacterium]
MMTNEPHKLITCNLPKGTAKPVIIALKSKYGIITANMNFSRGIGKFTCLIDRGIEECSEKEILTVMAPAAQADEIFEFIFHEAHVDRPHGGMMYMHPLKHNTSFALPDLPKEKAE